jgi:hypothetical protein
MFLKWKTTFNNVQKYISVQWKQTFVGIDFSGFLNCNTLSAVTSVINKNVTQPYSSNELSSAQRLMYIGKVCAQKHQQYRDTILASLLDLATSGGATQIG